MGQGDHRNDGNPRQGRRRFRVGQLEDICAPWSHPTCCPARCRWRPSGLLLESPLGRTLYEPSSLPVWVAAPPPASVHPRHHPRRSPEMTHGEGHRAACRGLSWGPTTHGALPSQHTRRVDRPRTHGGGPDGATGHAGKRVSTAQLSGAAHTGSPGSGIASPPTGAPGFWGIGCCRGMWLSLRHLMWRAPRARSTGPPVLRVITPTIKVCASTPIPSNDSSLIRAMYVL